MGVEAQGGLDEKSAEVEIFAKGRDMLIILGVLAALTQGGAFMPAPPSAAAHRVVATVLGPEVVLRTQMPALAPAQADMLDRAWQVLQLEALMPVLRDEAATEAAGMQAEGLIAGSGPDWAGVVARIHDPDRLERLFREGAAEALARTDPAVIDRALRFHAAGLGRQVVGLEISARRAMLEEGIEEAARQDYARARDDGQPRAAQIDRMIDRADLIAPNVAGALNATIAFSRGFAAGEGFDMPLTPQQMMAEAWAQRDQIEADATGWLQGFLMLSYGPLSDAELDGYTDWLASAEGRAMSQLLFAGFDRAFGQTSYDMGLAAALRLQGRQL
ncbi:hypothetical protein PANO111632_05305 [Paracoccus nototheniae]